MTTKTIELKNPPELFGKPVTHVEIREPTGGQYLSLGEPRIVVRNVDGAIYLVDDRQAIESYLKQCVMHDHAPAVLSQLSLTDARRVREKFLGFFTDADPATSETA